MRRFGISIPEDLAGVLDSFAEKLGVSRSEIVREALKIYFRDHRHYMMKHRCCGIITVLSKGLDIDLLECYKDIINNFSHLHIEGYCINSFFVSGDSERIAELHKRLLRTCKDVRYIPIRCANIR